MYRNQGRCKEAEELEVQVLETRERELGEGHPSTLTSMNNLSSTLKDQGCDNEAVSVLMLFLQLGSRFLVLGILTCYPHSDYRQVEGSLII
jgi:hypothetical protein